jgi:beta-lactamase regulating signal transducer with metallopeptidase domain
MHLETHFPLLLDLLLKSTVLLVLSALLTAAFRRASAANRHAIAVAALVTLLVLPFTKLAQPRWSFAVNHDASVMPLTIKLPSITSTASSESAMGTTIIAAGNTPVKPVDILVNWSAVGVGIWFAGFSIALMHRAGVGLQLRRLAGESRAMKEGRILAMAQHLAVACGVRVEIRESEICRVPLAFGVWRPTVLLPSEATSWSDERLSAALQHEFGHIRRWDCLTRWFADLACAFYWMNPLVWLGARSLRLMQEQACDDLVLKAGSCPDDYATQLVEAVRSLQGDRFAARHALAMAQPSTLESRVLAIVDASRDRSPRGGRATAAGWLSAVAALWICLAAQVLGADQVKATDAMRRGLTFLATQQRDDGSLGSEQFSGRIGLTSLAGLALMADDAQADRVKKVAKFIQSAQRDDGFIAGKSMYDHGYATLFLAEYFKATSRADLKASLARAVELIVKSQGKEGGWRYTPTPADGDTSVSACQLMALVAARNAGVEVPVASFNAGIGFLKRCQNADGGFGYTMPGSSAFARSAAALSAMLATVKWTGPTSRPDAIKKSADYLMDFLPQAEGGPKNTPFFIHGHYYASQALQLLGGDHWNHWQDAIRENLVSSQEADGSWADSLSVELATSEACLILQNRKSVPTK